MPHQVIMDVDTGLDDAIALLIGILSPEINLIGVTTVRGNHPVHICTENTLRVVDYLGAPVPVYEGMSAPLFRKDFNRGTSHTHGDLIDLPPALSVKQQKHAVDWLIGELLASDGDITLVPVGPLTNIAAAIIREPLILPKIKELVIMGGGHAISNMTASAEFNMWVDPEAAKVVMNCGRPIRLITLDATYNALVSMRDVTELREAGTAGAVAAAKLLEKYIAAYDNAEAIQPRGMAPVHDALAILSVIDPLIVKTHFVHVDVETKGELTVGRTVCDLHNVEQKPPCVHVALDADQHKFTRMLHSILTQQG